MSSTTPTPTNTTNNPTKIESYTTYFKKYERLIEYKTLRTNCPDGVFVIPSPTNPTTEWFGVVFVHSGYYQGGIFRFVMSFGDESGTMNSNSVNSSSSIKIRFITDMFHPFIDSFHGIFDIGLKSIINIPTTTSSTTNSILSTLIFLKKSLTDLDALLTQLLQHCSGDYGAVEKHCSNKDAFRMYISESNLFRKLSFQCSQLSSSESILYDALSVVSNGRIKGKEKASSSLINAKDSERQRLNHQEAIRFFPLNDSQLEEIKAQIFGDDYGGLSTTKV